MVKEMVRSPSASVQTFLALMLSAVKAAPLMRILLDILAVSGRMVTTGATQASLVASY